VSGEKLSAALYASPITKKIVIIKSSETRQESHSEYALDSLKDILQKRVGEYVKLSIKEYHLAEFLTEIPTPETLNTLSPDLRNVVEDFFDNDLLLIGTPNKNFAPSILLQVFFQKMRYELISLDGEGKVLSRNFYNHNIGIVITGRSSQWKWWFLNRFIFFAHFDLLFDFWGKDYNDNIFRLLFKPQNRIRKFFIPDAQKATFNQRKGEFLKSMNKFSDELIPLLLKNGDKEPPD